MFSPVPSVPFLLSLSPPFLPFPSLFPASKWPPPKIRDLGAFGSSSNGEKLKFHWDQFPVTSRSKCNTEKSPTSYEEVTRKLATFRLSRHVKMVWRRRQQVRQEVTVNSLTGPSEIRAKTTCFHLSEIENLKQMLFLNVLHITV